MSKTTKALPKFDPTKKKTWVFELTNKVSPRGKTMNEKGQEIKEYDIPFQPLYGVKNPVLVYDEVSGRERYARLLNGASSIWQDEQDSPKEIAPSAVIARKRDVQFTDGVLVVDTPEDALLVQFLLVHDDFDGKSIRKSGKPAKFTLVSDVSVEAELEKMEKEEEAYEKADSVKKIEDIKPHALLLGISMMDRYGQPITDKMLKMLYKRAAKARPEYFLKTFDNPATKASYLVGEAVKNGIIDLNKIKGQAHWQETGALIVALDPQKDPIQFLTEFAISDSEEGQAFNKHLIQLSQS